VCRRAVRAVDCAFVAAYFASIFRAFAAQAGARRSGAAPPIFLKQAPGGAVPFRDKIDGYALSEIALSDIYAQCIA